MIFGSGFILDKSKLMLLGSQYILLNVSQIGISLNSQGIEVVDSFRYIWIIIATCKQLVLQIHIFKVRYYLN